MKLSINVSITVGRSTLDYFSKATVKRAIKQLFREKLVNLPPTYTIEKIRVDDVKKASLQV